MALEAFRRADNAPGPTLIGVAGVVFEAHCEGVLWWPDEGLLAVADLHLEKGSSFARRGQLVPPYDTTETLARLARLIARFNPSLVIALGDSFHDTDGPNRMARRDGESLAALQDGRTWVWLAGNHDPEIPDHLSGERMEELCVGPVTFRHEPAVSAGHGEIAGHLHPAARVYGRGKSVRRNCFVGDGNRLIMPAFGAYTGGLDIRDPAFAGLFELATLRAFLLGEDQIYAVGRRALRF